MYSMVILRWSRVGYCLDNDWIILALQVNGDDNKNKIILDSKDPKANLKVPITHIIWTNLEDLLTECNRMKMVPQKVFSNNDNDAIILH